MNNTSLKTRIQRLIETSGPISVSEYMTICLSDPDFGYYMTRDPFGTQGDFITAPDISQMFGELIAIWSIGIWHALEKPSDIVLCEIGPGRATLMNDMLRTITQLAPSLAKSAKVVLVETSPRLIERQKEVLGSFEINIQWIDRFDAVPHGPLILVSNELFDALPIRQFVKYDGRFVERLIGLDEAGNFQFVSGVAGIDASLLPKDHNATPEGTIFEVAPSRAALMQQISERIATSRGAALTIDYGHLKSGFGDTLQAMLKHAYDDVFANPGVADLTSHVDFQHLEEIAIRSGCKTGTMTQGEFLLAMGLIERAGRLGSGRGDDFQNKLRQDVERLAAPDQMGDLFKVLAIADSKTSIFPFESQSEQT